MKITKFTCYPVLPRWLFLKLETDEGIIGWGEPVVEGRAHTVQAAVEELSYYFLGKNPMAIEDLWQTFYRAGFYRGGPEMMSAIAGIDQALWDIKGKALNAPVYELLAEAAATASRCIAGLAATGRTTWRRRSRKNTRRAIPPSR